jgi:hypothetical protein
MIRSAVARGLRMPLVTLALIALSGGVQAAQPPQAHTSDVTAAQGDAAGSTVSYLRELMDSHQLTELRTTYNGTYGASLLFQADKLTYFVALFHDKAFWRVIRTDSEKDADSNYRT